jgi:hypothetical protein
LTLPPGRRVRLRDGELRRVSLEEERVWTAASVAPQVAANGALKRHRDDTVGGFDADRHADALLALGTPMGMWVDSAMFIARVDGVVDRVR